MSRARKRAEGAKRLRALVLTMSGGLALASGAINAGCSSSDTCVSTRTYFEQNVWSAFMGSKCTKCHTPDGPAVAQGAKLVLEPSSYPGFIDQNLATLQQIASIEYSGVSELLLKPIGEENHGGGVQIDKDGPEYQALVDLVKRFDVGDNCQDQPGLSLQGVTTLNAASTFRKATLSLGGRLPTDDEIQQLTDQGDAALDPLMDNLLKEDAFYDRLREIYNDILLTDKYLAYDGAAFDILDDDDYPSAVPFKDPNSPLYQDARHYANMGIAREPLNLIAYVAKNDKKFTEILTADYTVVNPFQAQAYGVTDAKFKNSMDPNEYEPGHVTIGGTMNVPSTPIPHAGVLSTPAFLNRWPTTPTNRSRGRARRVFAFFLATDILKIAERPIDATKVTQQEDPTENSQYCNVCHRIIDPVAGGFRGYDENNYVHFDPSADWHDDMFSPGFGNASMDPAEYGAALQWLTAQVAADPRFVISTVQTVYKGLTGQDPIQYPSDPTVPDFQDALASWTTQDQFFRGVGQDFVNSNYNVKTIFKDIVKSVYYRADGVSGAMNNTQLAGIGTAHLLSPEALNRKITAVMGAPWRKNYDLDQPPHYTLLEDYDILYGGIDSDSTITRLTDPNGVIANVAQRMANEMACEVTAYDFTQPKAQRRFFKYFDVNEVPEVAGNTVGGSVADIQQNIQYLHKLILDEDLALDDPELQRTYQLYLATWREMVTASADLPYDCWGRVDWNTGVTLPDAQVIQNDPTGAIRSWQAVIAYLLTDYRFMYE